MKKALVVLLVAVMILSITACGGTGASGKLVGRWELSDGDGGAYGYGLEFKKDGTMTYAIDSELFTGTETGMTDEEWDEAMDALSKIYTIKYKAKSDTSMDITVSALMGLGKETTTVEYSLNGDTLIFDGSTYTRIN